MFGKWLGQWIGKWFGNGIESNPSPRIKLFTVHEKCVLVSEKIKTFILPKCESLYNYSVINNNSILTIKSYYLCNNINESNKAILFKDQFESKITVTKKQSIIPNDLYNTEEKIQTMATNLFKTNDLYVVSPEIKTSFKEPYVKTM